MLPVAVAVSAGCALTCGDRRTGVLAGYAKMVAARVVAGPWPSWRGQVQTAARGQVRRQCPGPRARTDEAGIIERMLVKRAADFTSASARAKSPLGGVIARSNPDGEPPR
jgi:hypothetical protein